MISTGYDPFFKYKGYYTNAIDTDIYVYKNNPAGAEVINTFANAIKESRYIYVKDMSYYLNIINESLSKRIKTVLKGGQIQNGSKVININTTIQ